MAAFDISPTTAASGRIRELLRRIAVEAFGSTETEVPIPGFTVFTDRKLDDPFAGIRAALLMRTVAEGQLYEYARAARAAGRSWDEVGAALDLSSGEYRPVGEAAFDWLVCGRVPDPEPDGVRSFRTPSAYWRCSTCDGLVTDHGQFEGNPANSEDGHAKGCARHAAEVQAWNEGWEH
ncbi:hypothetical protein EV383_5740 [Pseudonocardia sediminis]|uniref:Uncharacterized protein n=1 Tax=Pseudonocardia sediminis TaxID=1397368 RepID=A0A4Q7V7K3_PSEST|nr:hypothetical protein [Pseudonocardia sediminis]RZT88793.1 hypothetical protein EV383_5740 [Pseudonocardia sediminis]